MTTMKDRINSIMGDGFSSMKARRDACRNHNDSYHLHMAIREHGEQNVVIEMAAQIAKDEDISFIDASPIAAQHVKYVLSAAVGDGYGKPVRDALNGDE